MRPIDSRRYVIRQRQPSPAAGRPIDADRLRHSLPTSLLAIVWSHSQLHSFSPFACPSAACFSYNFIYCFFALASLSLSLPLCVCVFLSESLVPLITSKKVMHSEHWKAHKDVVSRKEMFYCPVKVQATTHLCDA